MAVATAIFGLLEVFGVLGVLGGATSTDSLLILAAISVVFVIALTATVSVWARLRHARVVAFVAGIALCLTCLGSVLGIPVLVTTSRGAAGDGTRDDLKSLPEHRRPASVSNSAEPATPPAAAMWIPDRRSGLPHKIVEIVAYIFLVAIIAGAGLAAATYMSGGAVRYLTFLLLVGFLVGLIEWVAIGQPTAGTLMVTPHRVEWLDQRLHRGGLDRSEISRIESRRVVSGLQIAMTGTWLVDIAGNARLKLSRRVQASRAAEALGVPLIVHNEVVPSQALLEAQLPGAGEFWLHRGVMRYGAAAIISAAALALDHWA